MNDMNNEVRERFERTFHQLVKSVVWKDGKYSRFGNNSSPVADAANMGYECYLAGVESAEGRSSDQPETGEVGK